MNYKNIKQILYVSSTAASLFFSCLGMDVQKGEGMEERLEREVQKWCYGNYPGQTCGGSVESNSTEKPESIKRLLVESFAKNLGMVIKEELEEDRRGTKRKRADEDSSEEDSSSSSEEESDENMSSSCEEDEEFQEERDNYLAIVVENQSKKPISIDLPDFRYNEKVEKKIVSRVGGNKESLLDSALDYAQRTYGVDENKRAFFLQGDFNAAVYCIVNLYNIAENKKAICERVQGFFEPKDGEQNLFQKIASYKVRVAKSEWSLKVLSGVFGVDINKVNKNNETPIEIALSCGNFGTAAYFVKIGANVFKEDENGNDALMLFLEKMFEKRSRGKNKFLWPRDDKRHVGMFLKALFEKYPACKVDNEKREKYVDIIKKKAPEDEEGFKSQMIEQIKSWQISKEI